MSDEKDSLMKGAMLARSSLSLGVEDMGAAMKTCRDVAHRIREGGFLVAYDYVADATAMIGKVEVRLHEAKEKLRELAEYLEQHHVGDGPPFLEDEPTDDGH